MVKNQEVEGTSISGLTELRVKELMQVNLEESGHFDKDRFNARMSQAKLGMTYVRDREQTKRIEQGQTLRAITLITKNDKLREEYIKKSMPKLLPKGK